MLMELRPMLLAIWMAACPTPLLAPFWMKVSPGCSVTKSDSMRYAVGVFTVMVAAVTRSSLLDTFRNLL
uniref:Secreted protein n=1 Tax=Ixodes ricinus TaxID=34613 RepID=A0A6B0TX25_IXORI